MRIFLRTLIVAAIEDLTTFGEVKGSGMTLMVPAKVEMKPCRTLVMQPSAGRVCLWTAAEAHLYGEGKCQLFVKTAFTLL